MAKLTHQKMNPAKRQQPIRNGLYRHCRFDCTWFLGVIHPDLAWKHWTYNQLLQMIQDLMCGFGSIGFLILQGHRHSTSPTSVRLGFQTNITEEYHHFDGQVNYKWPSSIAMLVYQRVSHLYPVFVPPLSLCHLYPRSART